MKASLQRGARARGDDSNGSYDIRLNTTLNHLVNLGNDNRSVRRSDNPAVCLAFAGPCIANAKDGSN